MKICMVTSSYPKFPGDVTAPFIESIATYVARRGHEVHVLAPWHPDLRRAPVEQGVHLHFFTYAPTRDLNIWGYASSLEADVRVKWAIYPLTPVVMARGLNALRALTRRAPGATPFDLIQVHWPIPNGPIAAVGARRRGLPLVASLHGSDVFVAEQNRLAGRVIRQVFARSDAVSACSEDLRQRALALGAPPQRSRLIPYGVDPQAFAPVPGAGAALRQRLGLPPDTPVVLALGRLVYKKGFTYLIQAAPAILAAHPEARLVIVGSGDLAGALQQQVAALGLAERVLLPGPVARDLVPLYFSGADVFVLPSVVDQQGNVDGLPNALLEAMASQVAIVASDVAGVPLAITHEHNGLLVPPKDAPALAQAVTRLLDAPELRVRYGAASRARVETDLNWEHVALQFERLYVGAITRYHRRHGVPRTAG
jgi:glycosyltransferase involved in cell wall biosynthesis